MKNINDRAAQTPDRMDWIEGKERYEQQVLYVLAVLRRYPDYINVLEEEDREKFLRYYKPDWTEVGTFVRYHDQLLNEQPDIEASASWLLAKFCVLNQLMPPENLRTALQPSIESTKRWHGLQ